MCGELADICQGFSFAASVLACGSYYAQCEESGLRESESLFAVVGRVRERLSIQEGES